MRTGIWEDTKARIPEGWRLEGQVICIAPGYWAAYASHKVGPDEYVFKRAIAASAGEAMDLLASDFFARLAVYSEWREGLVL